MACMTHVNARGRDTGPSPSSGQPSWLCFISGGSREPPDLCLQRPWGRGTCCSGQRRGRLWDGCPAGRQHLGAKQQCPGQDAGPGTPARDTINRLIDSSSKPQSLSRDSSPRSALPGPPTPPMVLPSGGLRGCKVSPPSSGSDKLRGF